MSDTKILHNPRCSKSRETLKLLEQRDIQPEIIKYLDNPPSIAELDAICSGLNIEPLQLIRVKEQRFKELGLSKTDQRSRQEWLKIMHENPVLIERPVVIKANRYALGRPPEQVLDIL